MSVFHKTQTNSSCLKLSNYFSLRIIFRVLIIISIVYFFILIILVPEKIHHLYDSTKPTAKLHERIYIDWSNESFKVQEQNRTGPGEYGKPVFLVDKNELELAQEVINEYSHNGVVSDKISLDRVIPDNRVEECKAKKYFADLPPVSVVVIFHNEYLSSLLRTVHSVINRTPEKLLKEIILVDDCSDREFLKTNLTDHINTYHPDKIKLIRLPERSGLIRARMKGIEAAVCDIVVFMDGHVEVGINWLPPLIQPVVENYKTITEPIIRSIKSNTYEFPKNIAYGDREGFDWLLRFIWLVKPVTENPADNFPTPTVCGGIMAFNKTFFWELGGYDDQLDVYGGEQFDISFKVWICSQGKILKVPCSYVGHNFKNSGNHPFFKIDKNNTYILKNLRRVAEVFMDDEYREFLYYRFPIMKVMNPGDLTKQFELKDKLRCRSFKWYLNNVYPEFLKMYPFKIPLEAAAAGKIRNSEFNNLCITFSNETFRAESCNDSDTFSYFVYLPSHEIRMDPPYYWKCLDVSTDPNARFTFLSATCNLQNNTQYFDYYLNFKEIKWKSYCLDLDEKHTGSNNSRSLSFKTCSKEKSQQWTWDEVDLEKIQKMTIS